MNERTHNRTNAQSNKQTNKSMPTINLTTDGDAASTEFHRKSAARLSVYWRTKVEGLAVEVAPIEVEDDELQFYI